MQYVCLGKVRSGRECSMSVSWVREGRALQIYVLSMGQLCSSLLPKSLRPYCCSGDKTQAWDPARAACEPQTTEELLFAHPCRFYTQYEYKTGGKSCVRRNWWEMPSLIAYTDTAYKVFGQGFIAANIYAGFSERSLLCSAAASSLKRGKHYCSLSVLK